MSKGWIGVDLDGTLAYYNGWKGNAIIGAPIPAMVNRVKRWLREGKEVRIFTARVSPKGRDAMQLRIIRDAIDMWCVVYIGRALPITHEKDMEMQELWDDRAVAVQKNTGLILGGK